MGIEYTAAPIFTATFTVLASQLGAGGGTMLELGPLPKGIPVEVDVLKVIPFSSGSFRLNTLGSSSANIANESEVAGTTKGMASVANWRTSQGGGDTLAELMLAAQQPLYAYPIGTIGGTGEALVIVRYMPFDVGY